MIEGLILGAMLLNSGNAVESLEMNISHPYNVVENVNVIDTKDAQISLATKKVIGDRLYALAKENYNSLSKTFIYDFEDTEIINKLMTMYKGKSESYDWIILKGYPYTEVDYGNRDQGQSLIMEMIVNCLSALEGKAMYGLQLYNVPIKCDSFVGLTWSNNSRIMPYGNRIGVCVTDSQFRTILHELGHNIGEQALLYEEPETDDTLKGWDNNYWESVAECYVENNGALFNVEGRDLLLSKINQQQYKVDLLKFRENLKISKYAYPVFMEIKYDKYKMPLMNSDYLTDIEIDSKTVTFKIHGIDLENLYVLVNGIELHGKEITESDFDDTLECIEYTINIKENVNTISVFTFGEQIQEFNLIKR